MGASGGHGATIYNSTSTTTVINNYNIRNNNTRVVYRNLEVHNAVTAVSQTNFARGSFAKHVTVNALSVRRARAFAGYFRSCRPPRTAVFPSVRQRID